MEKCKGLERACKRAGISWTSSDQRSSPPVPSHPVGIVCRTSTFIKERCGNECPLLKKGGTRQPPYYICFATPRTVVIAVAPSVISCCYHRTLSLVATTLARYTYFACYCHQHYIAINSTNAITHPHQRPPDSPWPSDRRGFPWFWNRISSWLVRECRAPHHHPTCAWDFGSLLVPSSVSRPYKNGLPVLKVATLRIYFHVRFILVCVFRVVHSA